MEPVSSAGGPSLPIRGPRRIWSTGTRSNPKDRDSCSLADERVQHHRRRRAEPEPRLGPALGLIGTPCLGSNHGRHWWPVGFEVDPIAVGAVPSVPLPEILLLLKD